MASIRVNARVLTSKRQKVQHVGGAAAKIKYAASNGGTHQRVDHTTARSGTAEAFLQGAIQSREPDKTVGP